MDRFPLIITIGAALLGWVAGEMAIGDPAIKGWVNAQAAFLHYAAPAAGAIGVVLIGRLLQQHRHVGTPGPTIAKVAQDLNCGLIIMGARGLGSYTAAVLGSVAHGTLEHSSVPVLVVR